MIEWVHEGREFAFVYFSRDIIRLRVFSQQDMKHGSETSLGRLEPQLYR